jgi:hypothetical protein
LFLFLYLLAALGFELGAYTLSHSASPFLWWVFSREGLENYLQADFEPRSLLISASWVARITGVSHWHQQVLIIFEIGSHFMPRTSSTMTLPFVLPHIGGMTDAQHHTQPMVEIRSQKPLAKAGLEPWSFLSLPPK